MQGNRVYRNDNASFSIDLMSRFWSLVALVFNEDGTIKPHTKDARKQLISVCSQIDKTGASYGNARTGEMNEYNVRRLIAIFSNR